LTFLDFWRVDWSRERCCGADAGFVRSPITGFESARAQPSLCLAFLFPARSYGELVFGERFSPLARSPCPPLFGHRAGGPVFYSFFKISFSLLISRAFFLISVLKHGPTFLSSLLLTLLCSLRSPVFRVFSLVVVFPPLMG